MTSTSPQSSIVLFFFFYGQVNEVVPVIEKAQECRSMRMIQTDVDAGVCFIAPIWTVCWVVVQWWLKDGVMLSEGRRINERMKVQVGLEKKKGFYYFFLTE